jgi:hypothetical protein
MAKTVADFIWERLQAWNVHRLLATPVGRRFSRAFPPSPAPAIARKPGNLARTISFFMQAALKRSRRAPFEPLSLILIQCK